jgi:DNA topoisomerase-2
MNVSNFLNEQYSDSALYINYRSTPSYIDGLKNSTRKVVYTVKKQNIKSQMKVSALGSKVVDTSGYLHGDTSIQGAIVTLAQDFCGSNNLPIMEPVGSFGTRHIPEAAAPRYIFTKPSKYFDYLFRKEDDHNLIEQEFEGEKIEPMFYVPALPLILLNGSTGIGVGFASTILARDLNNIISIVNNFLNKKKIEDELFKPSWKGFKGEVSYLGDNKWEVRGNANLNGKKLTITEVPISITLQKYISILKKAKEKGIITKYIDYSENDQFNFEVTLSDKEAAKDKETIMTDLKLIETITENLVCIDENNSIKEFNSVKDIFKEYCKIRIEFLEKRLRSEIERLESEKNYLNECVSFILEVINNTINPKVKKDLLEKELASKGYKIIDKLISMPIYSLTEDKVEELKKRLENKILELEKMKKETPITLWKNDLKELEEQIG